MSSRETIAKIKAEVTALQRQDGSYHPQDVVNFARENPESELHACFEWDNEVASREYRLWQARQVIVKYAVRIDMREAVIEAIPVISVPSLRGTPQGSYLDRDTVTANEAYRIEVLAETQAKLRTLRESLRVMLPELKPVWNAIDRTC